MSEHECPGGCGKSVPRRLLACRSCWYRLPKDVRDEVNATNRLRDINPSGHRSALRVAMEWYRAHPGRAS